MGTTVPVTGKLITFAAAIAAVTAAGLACGGGPARAQHLNAGCASARRIALTFDDGPNPPYTDRILDELTAAGARATFFVEGQAVEAHPGVARREAALGMAIGSHSYGHSQVLPSMRGGEFAGDLAKAEAAIRSDTGEAPVLYRAPYGHTSDTMLRELRRASYTSIGWDVDSEDWSDVSVDRVVSDVIGGAHPGAIVLMHDGGLGGGNPDRATTLAALPRIIDGLRAGGYELVTVPELTGLPASRSVSTAPEATCSAN
jgi:peptidoglycan/xylan/chitin deacetylase (PgdA/CDA1 family)